MIARLQGEEPARAKVREILEQASRGETKVSMSPINVGEVFYLIAKRHGAASAERSLADLTMMPIQALLPVRRLILSAAPEEPLPYFLCGRRCRGNGAGAKRPPGDWRPRTVATHQTRAHRVPLVGQEATPPLDEISLDAFGRNADAVLSKLRCDYEFATPHSQPRRGYLGPADAGSDRCAVLWSNSDRPTLKRA